MTTTLTRPAAPPLNGQRPTAAPPPPTRRNHTRMALGVVIVILSVLGVVALYGSASDRIEVVAVRQPVAAGQLITAADLTVVSISSDTELATIDASNRESLVGQVAVTALVPGSLLARPQVSDGPRIPEGMALAGATLKPGQYPPGLRAGDAVVIIESPPATATGAAATPIERGRSSVIDLEALDDASSSISVSLLVPEASASAISSAGAAGRLSVVVVSGS